MVVIDSVWLDRVWDRFNRIGFVPWRRIDRLDMAKESRDDFRPDSRGSSYPCFMVGGRMPYCLLYLPDRHASYHGTYAYIGTIDIDLPSMSAPHPSCSEEVFSYA
ncbi:hypothetical protein PIB30_094489 [Stylosanthes scabra]|uniref:Uncharacterized protein n=1 Tax=Stylosanthes scabra TaxID=79078 RepID=A0ABU6UW75_9FABA|nr:hypothetical protein [Stylosanthes scabra]